MINGIIIICIVLSVWLLIEPHTIVINRIKLKDKALKGLKIVFASDFHIKFYEEKRLQKIVDMINKENADLILSTGDFFSGYRNKTTLHLEKITKYLGELKAKYGFYTSLGNHDYYRGNDKVKEELEKVEITVLSNQNTVVQIKDKTIYIAGVEDLKTGHPDVNMALENTSGSTILLTHSPDVFKDVPTSVNLTLAGHLHGGQVRFPVVGAVYCPSEFGTKYAMGVFEEDGKKMVVTSGIGTSKLPIRFLCPPEIVVIEFEE
ncbi:metallophosphoesterase [bacterium]|nr:metallophosphoesterase [bacterium]